jgi:hypothetical protein
MSLTITVESTPGHMDGILDNMAALAIKTGCCVKLNGEGGQPTWRMSFDGKYCYSENGSVASITNYRRDVSGRWMVCP